MGVGKVIRLGALILGAFLAAAPREPIGSATHGEPVTHRIGHSAGSPSTVTLPVG